MSIAKKTWERLVLAGLLAGLAVAAIIGYGPRLGADALQAKIRLGGDIELHQGGRPIPLEGHTYLIMHSDKVSHSMELRTNAKIGEREFPFDLKSVDDKYPLYGELALRDKNYERTFTESFRQRTFGVAVDQAFLTQTGLIPGGKFEVGQAVFVIRAVIDNEPDRELSVLTQGPRVLVSENGLMYTGLVRPESNIYFRYRVKLPEGVTLEGWKKDMIAAFPESGKIMRDWRDVAAAKPHG